MPDGPSTSDRDDRPVISVARHPMAARQAILRGLRESIEATVGPAQAQDITLILRQDDRLLGGLLGVVSYAWLFVEALWVEAGHRHAGHGRALLQRAETDARGLGASKVFLNTFSFQAPGFYARLGYRDYGRLDDFPAGHQRIFMTKAL